MFGSVLKGMRSGKKGKASKWRTFSNKDANRWKREGSVQSMMKLKKVKRVLR